MSPHRAKEQGLAQKLAEAEATIEALLSGQIDAIVDPQSATPLLLAQAQGSLRASEERYRLILETTEEGIWLTEANGLITFVNRSMAEMLGCSSAECLGKRYADFLDGEGQERLARYLNAPGGGFLDLTLLRADGGSTWVQLHAVPHVGRDGQAGGVMAMVTNLSSRRAAALALRKESDRAQRYLDTAEVFLVALDLDGRIVLVNRYGCDVLGRSAESLLGKPWIETCTPERFRDFLIRKHGIALRGGGSIVEYPIVSASGEERLIEWRNTLQFDEESQLIGTFSSGTDITDRARAVAALSAAEERIRFTLRSTNIGVWDQDYASGLLRWSEILEAQYGYAPGTFGGTFDEFTSRIHHEDRAVTVAVIEGAMRTGGEFVTRHRIVRPDGEVRFVTGAGSVMLDGSGRPMRAVGISQDVTEREELQRQFQHSQKMEAFGQLAGGIAHDFNNILSVILGCGELLISDLDPLDPARDDAAEIVKAARRAADLTRQLLMFSRKQVIIPRVLDLADVAREMSGMLRRVVGEDIALHFEYAQTPGIVRVDQSSIEQVILNLVVNARDAMPTGGEITIATSYTTIDPVEAAPGPLRSLAKGSYILLTVRDSGMGMDEVTQRRMFEPFFTTKPVGKGTGLGLSTIFGIVNQNHGAVTVESALGQGATFSVYIPEAHDTQEPSSAPRALAAARGRETLLLVEDEDQVRAVAKLILERSGYRVIEMRSSSDALRFIRHDETAIDLLVTDVVMPVMSGAELARHIVELRPSVKVLYVSGYTDDSIVRHGVLEGEHAFLQKPFTPDSLRNKVREVLDH